MHGFLMKIVSFIGFIEAMWSSGWLDIKVEMMQGKLR